MNLRPSCDVDVLLYSIKEFVVSILVCWAYLFLLNVSHIFVVWNPLNIFKKIYLFHVQEVFFCMYVSCIYVCMYYVYLVPRGSEECFSPLDLEVWMVMSHHMAVGNWIWALCKKRKYSSLLSHLYSPCGSTTKINISFLMLWVRFGSVLLKLVFTL